MNIPCKNCITLSICLGNDPLLKVSGTAIRAHIEGPLCRKCALINEFIYGNSIVAQSSRYKEVVDFYRDILGSTGA